MTDEEFILNVVEQLKTLSVQAQVTNSPDTLFLGSYSYMRRFQLVALAKAVLELEGYEIINKAIKLRKYETGCQCGDSFIGKSGVTCLACKERGSHGPWCEHETHPKE